MVIESSLFEIFNSRLTNHLPNPITARTIILQKTYPGVPECLTPLSIPTHLADMNTFGPSEGFLIKAEALAVCLGS